MITTSTITHGVALLTIIGQGLVALYVLGFPWRKKALRRVYDFAGEYALPGALLVVIGGMFGSLYFSEIAKFPPCTLCWYQRILMYPQLLLIGLAMAKKNRDVIWQVGILSGLGLSLAVYQTYLQYGGTEVVPCSTTSFAVSCAQQNFLEFGYITIPVMAVTGFVMILIAMVLHRQHGRRTKPTDEDIADR